MSGPQRNGTVIIVGGGATGVILAAHLLKSEMATLRVILVERRAAFGEGLAYSTQLPDHLLNVSDRGMSALAFDPTHFTRWLAERHDFSGDRPYFAQRALYRDYLRDVLDGLVATEPVRLRLVNEEATSIRRAAQGIEVVLGNGSSLVGHAVVLASGHDRSPSASSAAVVRPDDPTAFAVAPDERVVVLGTGLSMIDAFLSLEAGGHRAEIVAVSRRGLLPSPHKVMRPLRLDSADIPFGTSLAYFVRWFRGLVRDVEAEGGDWRDVVDGLRPYNQRIWQSLPAASRRRFLEHTKAWWDVRRHRTPPEIHVRVMDAVSIGRLRLVAGRVTRIEKTGTGAVVVVEPRGTGRQLSLEAGLVIDCTGIVRDLSGVETGIIADLMRQGLARTDPLRLGLDVTTDCAVIDASGAPSTSIFAAGPLTRGTFFEIDSIPEIREQCSLLATRLAG
jgi:uncharacterized NAD(P)/FAD-binding protein YdhS